jgi:hypothetical protein
LEREGYEDLRSGTVPVGSAFSDAEELVLCGVVAEDEILAATVFDVARYDDVSEVPTEFLPGAPYVTFPEDLEITVD